MGKNYTISVVFSAAVPGAILIPVRDNFAGKYYYSIIEPEEMFCWMVFTVLRLEVFYVDKKRALPYYKF